jgi:hypothetical protein
VLPVQTKRIFMGAVSSRAPLFVIPSVARDLLFHRGKLREGSASHE